MKNIKKLAVGEIVRIAKNVESEPCYLDHRMKSLFGTYGEVVSVCDDANAALIRSDGATWYWSPKNLRKVKPRIGDVIRVRDAET